MSAEENEVFEFLRSRGENFVSVAEISKCLGRGRRYQKDRSWASPILRRMEMDGILEANPYAEYRLKGAAEPPQRNEFKEALRNPGASLGDTTIIRIQDP